MENFWDLVSAIVLGLVVLIQFVAHSAKLKGLNAAELWKLLFYCSIMTLVVIEFLCLFNVIGYFRFEGLAAITLTVMHSLVFTGVSFLSIEEFTKIKIRALWKIPLIGSLLGLLAQEYQFAIHGGIWILTLFVFFKHRNNLFLIQNKVFGLLLWTIAVSFVRDFSFWYLNIVLIFFSLLTYSLWDMVVVKLLVWNNDEKVV